MRRELQYMQCKREGFQEVTGTESSSRKERNNLGKASNLPESHSDFSDSLKRMKDNTPLPTKKGKRQKAKPQLGQSTRYKVKAANSAENRKAGLFHSFSWLAISSAQHFCQSMSRHSKFWVGQDVCLLFFFL